MQSSEENFLLSGVRMSTSTGLGLIVTITLLSGCVSGGAMTVAPGVTVEFTCTGPDSIVWFVNGRRANTLEDCYRSDIRADEDSERLNYTATLKVTGNHTCSIFIIYCRVSREVHLHSTTLLVQGHLSPPEHININESVHSSTIKWEPPYSSLNNDTIHVDPHITHYTVYITDNYTENIIVEENVTETQYTFNVSNDESCPIYQVSAWNAGGEGNRSKPVQKSTPQVPYSITVAVTVEHVLHIHIDVDVVCTSRIPEFFLITVLTSAGRALRELNITHDQGQPVADFNISVPQSVDVCSLRVRISAGNSAGMSAPSEAVEIACPGDSTDSTTTATSTTAVTTAVTTASSSESGSDGNSQQGNSTTIVLVGMIAVIGGVVIVAATAGIICHRGHRKEKFKKGEIEMKPNQAYETVSLPGPSMPATQVHTKPCVAYEGVVHAHH